MQNLRYASHSTELTNLIIPLFVPSGNKPIIYSHTVSFPLTVLYVALVRIACDSQRRTREWSTFIHSEQSLPQESA